MTKTLDSAVRLLSRREHSAKELRDKLKQKGFTALDIDEAIASCQKANWQSDARFVDSYIRSRISQGYGPVRISQELKQKGIDAALVVEQLKNEQPNWLQHALALWDKKIKGKEQLTKDEMHKQQRFLLYRGFDMDVISQVIKEVSKR